MPELNPAFAVKKGIDGNLYAVFASNYELEQWQRQHPDQWANKPIACFGQYDNAIKITE